MTQAGSGEQAAKVPMVRAFRPLGRRRGVPSRWVVFRVFRLWDRGGRVVMIVPDELERVSRKEVLSVTLLQERARTEITRVPTASGHVAEWMLGIVGVVAAAVGAYMFYAPANWFLAGLAEAWYLGMFVGAGLTLAAAFGVFACRMYLADRSWTAQVAWATGLMALALAGVVVFAVIWIP